MVKNYTSEKFGSSNCMPLKRLSTTFLTAVSGNELTIEFNCLS